MPPAAPPNGLGSLAKSSDVAKQGKRVIPAIPLQFSRAKVTKKPEAKSASQENSTTAQSEKSDASPADYDQSTSSSVQYPTTPESLSSSLHKSGENGVALRDDQLRVESADVAGSIEDLQSQGASTIDISATTPAPEAWLESDNVHELERSTAQQYNAGPSNRNDSVSMPKSKPFAPRKAPGELPPPFYPSASTSTSTSFTAMQPPNHEPLVISHTSHSAIFSPASQVAHRASHSVTFNPEANFQPLGRRDIGMSRSASNGSARDRLANGHGSELHSPIVHQASPAFHEQKLASALNLQEFMLDQFNQSAFADSLVDLSPFTSPSRPLQVQAHIFILARSPTLRQMAVKLNPQSRIFHLKKSNKFITEFGIVQALRYLYGAPLLAPHDFMHDLSQAAFLDVSANAPAARAMTQAIGYIAAGYYLELPVIVAAGLECTRHIQRWDTIPKALSFALDGGLTKWWRNFAHQKGPEEVAFEHEPTFGEAGSQVLQDTLVYIALNFPVGFQLISTATQLREIQRLPTVIESRPSTSDPRLSLIQFGQLAIEDTGRPDFLTSFISSILISLPFSALKFLLEHPLFNPKVSNFDVAQATIEEREERRLKVLAAKRVKEHDRALWEETRWSETIVTPSQVFPGFQLCRSLDKCATNGEASPS